jgi:hypothetical protein
MLQSQEKAKRITRWKFPMNKKLVTMTRLQGTQSFLGENVKDFWVVDTKVT